MKNILLLIVLLGASTHCYAQYSARPNILLVIVDDGRYQDYASTGGPSWFITPSINRIANEGANFKNDYVVLSLCEPSRVSVLTGKYPHHNGFIYNYQIYDTTTLTIARILRDNGYYTGLVGKFLNSYEAFPSADFDYWCAYDGQGNYNPKVFNLNGADTLLDENVSVAINDYAIHFLQSVPSDKPFFLMLSTKAPHPAYVPYPGFENAYDNKPVTFPDDFNGYSKNYPDYIYLDNEYSGDSASCVSDIQTYYSDLIGAEVGLDSVLSLLESSNILDSTLIMYTSDNGVFIGEHHMQKKRLAYEQSMHVPLFVRYPKWFAPGTVVSDEIGLNVDLFATMLDAASIEDTFNDDGISLQKLASGASHRKQFLFEYFKDTTQPKVPDFRAVRSLQYKYIWSSCDQETEEFYDLINDPGEDINQIFNPAYTDLIQEYRMKLDSMRISLGDDPSNDTVISCSLINVDSNYSQAVQEIETESFSIFPDPVGETLSVHLPLSFSGNVSIIVADEAGKLILAQGFQRTLSSGAQVITLPANQLIPGLYTIKVDGNNLHKAMLFVKN